MTKQRIIITISYLRDRIDDLSDHWGGQHTETSKHALSCGRYRLLSDALQVCKLDELSRQQIQNNCLRQNPGQQWCHYTVAARAERELGDSTE